MAGFLRLLALLATFLAVSGLSAYDPRNLLLPYEVSGTEEVLKGFTEWHFSNHCAIGAYMSHRPMINYQ